MVFALFASRGTVLFEPFFYFSNFPLLLSSSLKLLACKKGVKKGETVFGLLVRVVIMVVLG